MPVYYVESKGALNTTSATPVAIPGLTLTLPDWTDMDALVMLNLPNPYATGNNFPGAMLQIAVDNKLLDPFAAFTCFVQSPGSWGRVPTTLVAKVRLIGKAQTVTGMWAGIRGSTVIIDSPSSLSAYV